MGLWTSEGRRTEATSLSEDALMELSGWKCRSEESAASADLKLMSTQWKKWCTEEIWTPCNVSDLCCSEECHLMRYTVCHRAHMLRHATVHSLMKQQEEKHTPGSWQTIWMSALQKNRKRRIQTKNLDCARQQFFFSLIKNTFLLKNIFYLKKFVKNIFVKIFIKKMYLKTFY